MTNGTERERAAVGRMVERVLAEGGRCGARQVRPGRRAAVARRDDRAAQVRAVRRALSR